MSMREGNTKIVKNVEKNVKRLKAKFEKGILNKGCIFYGHFFIAIFEWFWVEKVQNLVQHLNNISRVLILNNISISV